MSCCCTCFNCLKCCGNCCGCCDPPGGRNTKYLDEPYVPPHHGQGYHAQAPMQPSFAPPAPAPAPAPARYAPPQYAEFDVPKKAGEDSLPQMPTWEQAGSKKVMLEEEVELSNLDKSPTPDQNRQRMNAPSPGPVSPMSSPMSPVSPMSTSHGGQSYGGLPGGSSGQMFNHSQQGLVSNQQAAGHGQLRRGPRQSPYGASDHGYNQNYDANRQLDGFGLDEPYDDPCALSRAAMHGRPGQQNLLYGAPAQQPYDSLANQPYGGALAAGGAGAHMETRNHTVSPQNLEPFGAPPVDAAAVGAMGLRNHSTSPNNHTAHGQSPYNQDQAHGQLAEMPAMPHDRSSVHTPAHLQQAQTWSAEHAAPMELPGSAPPEIHGARRPGPGPADNTLPGHARPPYGMDPRMRNSPGPRQTPGPRGESPYGRPPRGSPGPRNDEGYGRPPPQSPRENMNRSYSPAPPRQFTPGPERRFSPGPERQRTPGPLALSKPVPPPSNSFGQSSPPRSPITNNAGFDFTSGYSRPPGGQSPPAQSPTTAAYPGQRTYQPGR